MEDNLVAKMPIGRRSYPNSKVIIVNQISETHMETHVMEVKDLTLNFDYSEGSYSYYGMLISIPKMPKVTLEGEVVPAENGYYSKVEVSEIPEF